VPPTVVSPATRRADRWRTPVVLLGLMTIGAYGLVLYGFAAFVDPIREAQGWSTGAISAAFSMSTLGGGVAALWSGRWLDRVGPRRVMLTTLTLGSALLVLASYAADPWQLIVAWGFGGATIGAGLFYNVTMPVTARTVAPAVRPQAFTWLTVMGGLAAPVSFPVAGLLVEEFGWRGAVRGMVAGMAACAIPAIVVVGRGPQSLEVAEPTAPTPDPAVDPPAERPGAVGFGSIAEALADTSVRRWLVAACMAMAGLVAVQVHHVGAIEASGVSLATATSLASIRGLLSLPGRGAAAAVTARIGLVTSLRLVYLVMAIGTLALVAAGSIAWVWVFVILNGAAFGSVAPLQGLYATELYGTSRIGSLMGLQSMLLGVAGAAGPFLLGLTVDATGGYATLLIAATVLQVVAMLTFRKPVKAPAAALATTP
jgi:MFS family permease